MPHAHTRLAIDAAMMAEAREIAKSSTDKSVHTGTILAQVFEGGAGWYGIAHARGWNHIPAPIELKPERLERPEKYLWTGHAEEMAVVFAAKLGVATNGLTAYLTHFPCAKCARMLVGAGIRRVVYETKVPNPAWAVEYPASEAMFMESGIDTETGTHLRDPELQRAQAELGNRDLRGTPEHRGIKP